MATTKNKKMVSTPSHFLDRFLSIIKLPPFQRALLVAGTAHATFLVLAFFDDWNAIAYSFLHFLQLTVTITLFLAMWLGYKALHEHEDWFERIETSGLIAKGDAQSLRSRFERRLASPRALIFALPLVVPGYFVAKDIFSAVPNPLLPFAPDTPALIYIIVIELWILMIHLVGDTAFWVLNAFAVASRELVSLKSINHLVVDQHLIRGLSAFTVKLCFWFFLIVSFLIPSIVYVGNSMGVSTQQVILVFAVIQPIALILFAYSVPNYHLDKMFKIAKEKKITLLKKQLDEAEKALRKKVKQNSSNIDGYVANVSYLADKLRREERASSSSFNFVTALKLLGSAFLPIATIFSERLISYFF